MNDKLILSTKNKWKIDNILKMREANTIFIIFNEIYIR